MTDSHARIVEVVRFLVECPVCGWEHQDWVDWRDEAERIAARHCCPSRHPEPDDAGSEGRGTVTP